ncbi:uncharacterized protein LOC129593415 [Paramacrobiotus metropolitanus]|uniref:uncharacterized protein LOC129593415 n=1 Tax=Paramacrobiotus metropolitanus TaxID=2943436 RepID=UPI002445ECB2|nr:uncharacterized protein LOC129593415 [Paramacrobiotus metropolitanus]
MQTGLLILFVAACVGGINALRFSRQTSGSVTCTAAQLAQCSQPAQCQNNGNVNTQVGGSGNSAANNAAAAAVLQSMFGIKIPVSGSGSGQLPPGSSVNNCPTSAQCSVCRATNQRR